MKFVFLIALLVSCSSWDRERCLTTNWYQRGVTDVAETGHGDFPAYQRACAEEGISIISHTKEYERGMTEGMRSWCSFQNGFNQGLNGQGGTLRCDNVNPAFARGYEEGYREFRLNARRKRDQEELERKYTEEKEQFRRRVLSQSNTKECVVNSDCQREGLCRFSRCEHNQKACTYNYECRISGRCREVTDYARDRSVLTIRVCDYGGGYW